tara:strand:+ start:670 stop:963 length:294 start_codon:yes stop_codon:yes gene_type:complete
LLNNLINFFGANSKLHLLKIFIIFGLAGTFSVFLSEPLLRLLSIENFTSNKFFYWLIRLILIFPIYQFVLIGVALVSGEFRYFKKFFIKFINYFKIY